MPEFLNPFSGKVPDRKLTAAELIRAIRLDLAAEHEAVHLYMAHAEAADNPLAKKVLMDIADEERVHAGEFARLISMAFASISLPSMIKWYSLDRYLKYSVITT